MSLVQRPDVVAGVDVVRSFHTKDFKAAELVSQRDRVLGMPDQPAPLPSRSQVKKLGSRLRKPDPPTVEDLELLEQVRAAYGQALDQVVRALLDHGLLSTGRLKTTTTIVEKLRRNPSMGLLTMQDIAGTRIVAEMDRDEQDGMVEHLVGLFQSTEVVDRRTNPSFGYRAVHVIAREQGYPVEIQVRTGL